MADLPQAYAKIRPPYLLYPPKTRASAVLLGTQAGTQGVVPTWYPEAGAPSAATGSPMQAPSPSLVIREHNGQPFYEAKFRYQGRQVKRRVGPVLLERA